MLNKLNIYKYFIISVLASPFLGYFSNSGIIAYGPLIIFLILISLVELFHPSPMKKRDWLAILIWGPYVIWASYYYISNPLGGRYLTTHLLVILCLPFFVLSFLRLRNSINFDYTKFTYKIIIFTLLGQLIICIGQISTYILGFGLPVTEQQASDLMVAGTFNNSNDLGGVVLLLSFVFINIEKHIVNKTTLLWLIIITLLIISGSRSALFLTFILFITTRGLKVKNILSYSFLLLIVYIILNTLLTQTTDIDTVSRFSQRLDSLFNVLNYGLESDNSMALRLESYLYFIENIDSLGLGSGELENYFRFSDKANFPTYLIFQNPHSLIAEVGYWLGYPGLLSFLVAMLYLFQYSHKKILLFLVLNVSTLIPSSVLGSLVYFLFMINAFFPPLLINKISTKSHTN